jgi:hypothetical protein
MEELVDQFARVAGSFVEAVAAMLTVVRIPVHPQIAQS